MKFFSIVLSSLWATNFVTAQNLTSTHFDLDEANRNLWLSAAAYCGANNIGAVRKEAPCSTFYLT